MVAMKDKALTIDLVYDADRLVVCADDALAFTNKILA